MARTKEQNERMVLKTKNTIIEVALREFALKGFAYASIRDIAKASNMSTGIVYRYFETKEALFHYVVNKAISSLTNSIKEMETTTRNPYETLNTMTEKVLADIHTRTEVSLYFLLMSRLLIEGNSVSIIDDLRKQHLLLFDKTAAFIAKGQLSGELKTGDPDSLSIYYYSCIQGVATMRFFLKDKFISPKVEDVLSFLKDCPQKQGGK